jgi:hypothetical protein
MPGRSDRSRLSHSRPAASVGSRFSWRCTRPGNASISSATWAGPSIVTLWPSGNLNARRPGAGRGRPALLAGLDDVGDLVAGELLGDDPLGEVGRLLRGVEPADLVRHRRRQPARLDLGLDARGQLEQGQRLHDVRVGDG